MPEFQNTTLNILQHLSETRLLEVKSNCKTIVPTTCGLSGIYCQSLVPWLDILLPSHLDVDSLPGETKLRQGTLLSIISKHPGITTVHGSFVLLELASLNQLKLPLRKSFLP